MGRMDYAIYVGLLVFAIGLLRRPLPPVALNGELRM